MTAAPAPADHWAELGIAQGSSQAEIDTAFRALAKRHHPDTAGGDAEAFSRAATSHRVLSDPTLRAQWEAEVRQAEHDARLADLAQRTRAADSRRHQAREARKAARKALRATRYIALLPEVVIVGIFAVLVLALMGAWWQELALGVVGLALIARRHRHALPLCTAGAAVALLAPMVVGIPAVTDVAAAFVFVMTLAALIVPRCTTESGAPVERPARRRRVRRAPTWSQRGTLSPGAPPVPKAQPALREGGGTWWDLFR